MPNLKLLVLAGLFACYGSQALAANYFFVQPKSGEMSKVSPLSVKLNPSSLPAAVVGLAYNNGSGFDLKSVLSVSGDSGFNPALTSFVLTAGTLPSGLTLSAAGVISGTPTVTSAGSAIQVTATYKSTSGAQTYQVISLNLAVNLAAATLPAGSTGSAYNNGNGFDFATVLSAPADASFNASLATFTLTSGNMPEGMTLSTAGKLTGIPTATSASTILQVAANYKSNTGTQSYNWTAVESDPLFTGVSLLMHLDNNLTDVKGNIVTNYGVAFSSSKSKFGGYSAYAPTPGARFVIPADSFISGNAPFTVEFWLHPTAYPTAPIGVIVTSQTTGGFSATLTSEGKLSIGRSLVATDFTSIGSVPLNQWSHIAYVRTGTNVIIFINGQASGTAATAVDYPAGNANWFVDGNNTSVPLTNVYLDDIRVTRGTARYNTNYVVPSAPYISN